MTSVLRHPFLWILLLANVSQAQRTPEYAEEQKERILSHDKVTSVIVSKERLTPVFISLTPGQFHKGQAHSLLQNFLEPRQGIDDLKPERIVATPGGFEVLEYHQFYKGVRVEHSRYTAFVRNGSIHFFNGSFYDVPATLSITPALTENAGLERAKSRINAKKYAWEQVSELISKTAHSGSKAALQKELEEYLPKGELVIVENHNKDGFAEMRLAYKYNIYSFEPISRQWVYVDAINGEVLLIDKIIKHVDGDKPATATSSTALVQTRYAGVRSINTKQLSGNDPNSGVTLTASNPLEFYVPGSSTHGLIDVTRGNGVETYDLNGVGGLPVSIAAAYSQAKSFTDVDNDWTLSEHKRGGAAESENDDYAWDAHWGAGMVYDYWKQKHGRLSFDGNDAKIKSYIHSGIGYDNAFWNGKVMTYGDGSYPAPGGFRPLTSLDVCGHEIGHGVCEFTADLVYAKESGAMNEGFSDIWAACVEFFVVKNVDPSLGAIYKPFYIGEQIAANPLRPLRRMDNPKAESDPDTYGGQFWKNPNCSPTLANDYCGVHTNSGVLNKWFYLVTVGSGAGSGPDASFAGADDGINDIGNTYSVSGVGFDVSEKITYLTELMLTSTATFAEAREVSINVAAAISGNPCSELVKTVTNAWYAVNVGASFVQPCTITYGFTYQPGSQISEGKSGSGCDIETPVSIPIVLPPNSTASITLAGTAVNNVDYRISAITLSNTGTTSRQDSVTIFVRNDGVVEGDETVILNLAVTNAGINPVNTQYTLHIVEDDVTPVIGTGSITLLNENFTRADGFADPIGWQEILEVPEEPNGVQAAKGKNQWGIFGNRLAVTGRDEITGTQLPNGTYNTNSISTTIIRSPLVDARGLSTLQLKFDFEVQGEVEPNGADPDMWPALDYMAIVYSFDGVTWFELGQAPYTRFAAAAPLPGTFDYPLPSFLNNKQFYLGFRWNNDPYIGGPVSVAIDNLGLSGSPRHIENDLGHNSRESLGAGLDVYYYSLQDGEILGRVKNNSARNYGCTQLYVEKAGAGTFNLYQSTKDGIHKVSDKVIRIETGLIYKASTTITLYYTEDQLAALESATGVNRSSFSVYHVEGASYAAAATNNTKRYTPVYTTIPGVGGYYTVTLSDRANGSYALGYNVSVPGLQRSVTGNISRNWKFESMYPNPSTGDAVMKVTAPHETKISVIVVNALGQVVSHRSEDLNSGLNLIKVSSGKLGNGSYLVMLKSDKGEVLHQQSLIRN